MAATNADERPELRMRKVAIETAIRRLKLAQKSGEVTSRNAIHSQLFEIMNSVRMLIENIPSVISSGLPSDERSMTVETWRKALYDLLKAAASRAPTQESDHE